MAKAWGSMKWLGLRRLHCAPIRSGKIFGDQLHWSLLLPSNEWSALAHLLLTHRMYMTHVSYASFGLHQTTESVLIPLCPTVSHLRPAMPLVHFTTVVGLSRTVDLILSPSALHPFPAFPTDILSRDSYKYLLYEATPLILTLYEGNGYPNSIPSLVCPIVQCNIILYVYTCKATLLLSFHMSASSCPL